MGNEIFYPSFDGKREGAMTPIEVPCDAGEVSDGYHTFNELYEHRCLLFCVIIEALGRADDLKRWNIWKSRKHHDETEMEGWFIAGAEPNHKNLKPITYHLPNSMWDYIKNVPELKRAPKWDGHTSQNVIERLKEWLTAGRG